MRMTTLAFMLLGYYVYAQESQSLYCDIDDTGTITEKITSVEFADAYLTNSNNTNSILIDKTDKIANVIAGETYTIKVEGDTEGPFKNKIVAFIDWNQNQILNDQGEVYKIGKIIDSDGNDNKSVTMDINIPTDVQEGFVRVRITKSFTNPDLVAKTTPCSIKVNAFGLKTYPGFGQVLDFTLNVINETLGMDTFEKESLIAYPIPTINILNIEYKSNIRIVRIYDLLGKEVYFKNTSGSTLQLDLSSLHSGNYIVNLDTENGQHNFKIIKR